MKLKVAAGILALLLTLAGLFATWVYAASEAHLRSFKMPASFKTPIPDSEDAVARGEHIALTRGCRGCHGPDLAGELMWGMAVAPNLPALARIESAATLEAAIRHGIGRDGRALYSMPSYNFLRMRDADVADLIAYLRSLPVVEKELPGSHLPWPIRFAIASGQDGAIPSFLDLVPPLRGADLGNEALARGEYIAMTTCNECHGFSLRADVPWDKGDGEKVPPDLVIVTAYSEQDFRALMKTGAALNGRELEMMSDVARSRFANFSDDEVSDLYAFLHDMSARAITIQ